MKLMTKLKVIALATTAVGILGNMGSAAWAQFTAQEVDQNRLLSVAAPGSTLIPYKLYLIRQISNERPCFQVSGDNPGEVNPLWTTFDFSGICGRVSDSNGYSIRVNGEDLGPDYSLQVKEQNGELVLLGVPRGGGPNLVIGRSGGISSTGFTEIDLLPGWRITQRVYEGTPLGHFYYTNEATLAELLSDQPVAVTPSPTPTPPPTTPEPVPFPDIRGDIYANEIARAVDIGFVAGFQDGTFRPTNPVTREQAASMVVEALSAFLPAGESLPTVQVNSPPFPDVPVNRWSAEKIALLKQLGIVAGDLQGNYRPTATITRAELMAMLRKTAIAYRSELGLTPDLEPTEEVFNFSDTSGHWAQSTIATMSGYCGVATPFNERGNAFRPNTEALRNYTAAAIERLFNCGEPR